MILCHTNPEAIKDLRGEHALGQDAAISILVQPNHLDITTRKQNKSGSILRNFAKVNFAIKQMLIP